MTLEKKIVDNVAELNFYEVMTSYGFSLSYSMEVYERNEVGNYGKI